MRLDARTDPEALNYQVYHAEHCCMLRHVVWVDDETAQYGQCRICPVELETIQAKRIVISVLRRLIIINPIGDVEEILREALIAWLEEIPA